MAVLSAVLYFLTHHPFWAFVLLCGLGLGLGWLWGRRRGRGWWGGISIAFLLLAQANLFAGRYLNAWFLNAVGTEGSAVVTGSKRTSAKLNNSPVYAYAAVLRTADGRDVELVFDTVSAAIHPVRNAILIPPQGERFVAKYVPGFERNIVILSDRSDYGVRRALIEDRAAVDQAAAQLAVSPDNPTFRAEYREALRAFLAKHYGSDDPVVKEFERKSAELERAPR